MRNEHTETHHPNIKHGCAIYHWLPRWRGLNRQLPEVRIVVTKYVHISTSSIDYWYFLTMHIIPNHSWWRHQRETFSALLAICAGNSPVSGEFPTQRAVTLSFDVFVYLHPNIRLSKQWWGWWFETPSCPLWRHRNGNCEKWSDFNMWVLFYISHFYVAWNDSEYHMIYYEKQATYTLIQ